MTMPEDPMPFTPPPSGPISTEAMSRRAYLDTLHPDKMTDAELLEYWSLISAVEPASVGHDGLAYTDLGNAHRFVGQWAPALRFVELWRKYLVWDIYTNRWVLDTSGARSAEMFSAVSKAMWSQVKDAGSFREALIKWAKSSESNARTQAAVTMAKGAPGMMISHMELDNHPHLLNCRNGTIDLRTATLQRTNLDDLLTKSTGLFYDPTAKCPTFDAFLAQILPDPETRAFLQRMVGYTLTGSTEWHVLLLLHGSGANGKSTFIGAIQSILGDYAMVCDKSLLLASRNEGHPTKIAALFRARLASAVETGDGQPMDESGVKLLTGGDKLTGRRMREDPWEFMPTHKFWLACNYLPNVSGIEMGIWRRLIVIPFNTTIEPADMDSALPTKLAAEREGILAWAVEGARQFYADRRHPMSMLPSEITAANTAYRLNMDLIGSALADQGYELDPTRTTPSSHLNGAVKTFCDREGRTQPTSKAVGIWLNLNGCSNRKNGAGNMIWTGIGTNPDLDNY